MSMAPERMVKCPHCGAQWRTADQTPELYCRKCNRRFPNPYAAPEATE